MTDQNIDSKPVSLSGLLAGVWVRGHSQEYGGLTDSCIITAHPSMDADYTSWNVTVQRSRSGSFSLLIKEIKGRETLEHSRQPQENLGQHTQQRE